MSHFLYFVILQHTVSTESKIPPRRGEGRRGSIPSRLRQEVSSSFFVEKPLSEKSSFERTSETPLVIFFPKSSTSKIGKEVIQVTPPSLESREARVLSNARMALAQLIGENNEGPVVDALRDQIEADVLRAKITLYKRTGKQEKIIEHETKLATLFKKQDSFPPGMYKTVYNQTSTAYIGIQAKYLRAFHDSLPLDSRREQIEYAALTACESLQKDFFDLLPQKETS